MSEKFNNVINKPKFWNKYSSEKAMSYDKMNLLDELFNKNGAYGSNFFDLVLKLEGETVFNKKVLLNTKITKYYEQVESEHEIENQKIVWSPKYNRMILGGITSIGTYTNKPEFTITFMSEGVVYSSLTFYEGTVITSDKLPELPTKKYYDFVGWGEELDSEEFVLTEDITVNAVFTPNPPDTFYFRLNRIDYGIQNDMSNVDAEKLLELFDDTAITITERSYENATGDSNNVVFSDLGLNEMVFAMTKTSLNQPHFYDAMNGAGETANKTIANFYETEYKIICIAMKTGTMTLKY